MMDSILEELYARKEAIARRSGNDLWRMAEHRRERVDALIRSGYKIQYAPPPPPNPILREATLAFMAQREQATKMPPARSRKEHEAELA